MLENGFQYDGRSYGSLSAIAYTATLLTAEREFERFFGSPVRFRTYDPSVNGLEISRLFPTRGLRPFTFSVPPAHTPRHLRRRCDGCLQDFARFGLSGWLHSIWAAIRMGSRSEMAAAMAH